jgi:hypothetical protein
MCVAFSIFFFCFGRVALASLQIVKIVSYFGPVAKRYASLCQPGHHLFTLSITKNLEIFTKLQAERVQYGADSSGLFDPHARKFSQ